SPAPSNAMPRARKPISQVFVTGSKAIHDPIGGVASISNVAIRKSDEDELVGTDSAPRVREPATKTTQANKSNRANMLPSYRGLAKKGSSVTKDERNRSMTRSHTHSGLRLRSLVSRAYFRDMKSVALNEATSKLEQLFDEAQTGSPVL